MFVMVAALLLQVMTSLVFAQEEGHQAQDWQGPRQTQQAESPAPGRQRSTPFGIQVLEIPAHPQTMRPPYEQTVRPRRQRQRSAAHAQEFTPSHEQSDVPAREVQCQYPCRRRQRPERTSPLAEPPLLRRLRLASVFVPTEKTSARQHYFGVHGSSPPDCGAFALPELPADMDSGHWVLFSWDVTQPLAPPPPRTVPQHVSQIDQALEEENRQLYEIERWEAGRRDFDPLRLCELVGRHPDLSNRDSLRKALRAVEQDQGLSPGQVVAALPGDHVQYFAAVSCLSGSVSHAHVTLWPVRQVADARDARFWQPVFDRYAELARGAWFVGVTGTLEVHGGRPYLNAARLWEP